MVTFTQLLNEHIEIVKIALVLITAGFLTWLQGFLLHRFDKHLKGSTRIWDHAFIKALDPPLVVIIWLMTIRFITPILLAYFDWDALVSAKAWVTFQSFIIIITLFWFIMRYIKQAELGYQHQTTHKLKKHDPTTVRAIAQLLRVIAVVIVILICMNQANINIASLLAAGGIGGLAIGFAAKDTIANFLGGMMIYWDRPFAVGDWIRSPDREIEGTVENVGWRLTRIRTFDKRPLYVPNGTFSTISIENPSRMTNRRIKETIGLRYSDATSVGTILRAVEDMLRSHPEIDTNQTLMVNLFEFGASSLNFFVYTFTKTTDWVKFQAIQEDVFLKIIDIITQHGAECAFPTRTIDMPEPIQIQQS